MLKKRYVPMRDANDPQKVTLIPVNEEIYADITREKTRIQNKHQYHGRCCCPKQYLWKCNVDCEVCEYRVAGDNLKMKVTFCRLHYRSLYRRPLFVQSRVFSPKVM